jgi:hypothetical protein
MSNLIRNVTLQPIAVFFLSTNRDKLNEINRKKISKTVKVHDRHKPHTKKKQKIGLDYFSIIQSIEII